MEVKNMEIKEVENALREKVVGKRCDNFVNKIEG